MRMRPFFVNMNNGFKLELAASSYVKYVDIVSGNEDIKMVARLIGVGVCEAKMEPPHFCISLTGNGANQSKLHQAMSRALHI